MKSLQILLTLLLLVAPVADLTLSAADLQVSLQKEYELFEPIIIGCDCSLEKDESPMFLWNIPAPAKKVSIDNGKVVHVWAPAGIYEIVVTVVKVNWKTKQISQEEFRQTITIGGSEPTPPEPGPNPPTPPGPNPMPEDEFGNLGINCVKWARDLNLDKTAEIGKNFKTAAARLSGSETPILRTVSEASKFVSDENKKVEKNGELWGQWSSQINKLWGEHVKDRDSAVKFMDIVGEALIRSSGNYFPTVNFSTSQQLQPTVDCPT